MASFDVSERALGAIDEISAVFGAADRADMIRKALALATVAAGHTDPNGVLTIIDPKGGHVRVLLRGDVPAPPTGPTLIVDNTR